MKKRRLSLVLILAILTVAVAALVPIAGTAADPTPAEIQDFAYQTLSGAGVKDVDTDLRFVFTVGSLEYSEVGVIVSKSVATPTYDAENCHTHKTTVVHSSIVADGETINAPAGRYYVAAKLTDIPHSYFDGSLYIRAFVKDGESVRYSDAHSLTVCSALGHTHTPIEAHNAAGTATLLTEGTLVKHCDGCDLDLTFSGVKRSPVILDSGAGAGAYPSSLVNSNRYQQNKNVNAIKGDAHYYPTPGNPTGNDLLVEVSFLWNETLTTGAGGTFDFLNRDGYDVVNISMKDGVSGYAPAAGGIAARERSGYVYVYPTPAAIAENPALKYPNIGAYGWHRLGFRVHQEAALVADAVRYTYIVSTYVDGELVLSIDISPYANISGNARSLLFKARIENEELVCYDTDVQNQAYLTLYDFFKQAGSYLVIGDVSMTCGTDFVQNVSPVVSPEAQTITLGGNEYPAAFYYEIN